MNRTSFVLWTGLLAAAAWIAVDLSCLEDWRQHSGGEKLNGNGEAFNSFLSGLRAAPVRVLNGGDGKDKYRRNCSHYDCFDIYRCGEHPKKMLVHVPAPIRFLLRRRDGDDDVAPISKEFVEVLEGVFDSGYHTEDPLRSCVFVPAVDAMSQLRPGADASAVGAALASSSPFWNGGSNNLVFNPFPSSGDGDDLPVGKAVRAAAGLTTHTYRPGFDIALPALSPLQASSPPNDSFAPRRWVGLFARETTSEKQRLAAERLARESSGRFVAASAAQSDGDDAPPKMSDATFCFVFDLRPAESRTLILALHHGCVPVIVEDSAVLPFSEVLDWKLFSVRAYEHDLEAAVDLVAAIGERRVAEMRSQLHLVYRRHFSSWGSVARTALDVLNDRVVRSHVRTYDDWNVEEGGRRSPLFHRSASPPPEQGFTAVVLAYDRLDSLFSVIRSIAATPSLSRIVVVWNNQESPPPRSSDWPQVGKPLKVIRTRSNALSNRFYPYDEIATEGVLSLDDDIDMLTADELEFGFQVWREFPDRLVGFPSRTHRAAADGGGGRYRYESEWTSELSMVLTGAAFYHKYWHYLYTAAPSPAAREVRRWVDDHMNCEDIAMNFLIANATANPPLKVAPRKKFKCSTAQCFNKDMSLSGQYDHMVTRSECVNMLAEKYGGMPLRHVDFRVDPVLYKDQVPDKMKRFLDVGSL